MLYQRTPSNKHVSFVVTPPFLTREAAKKKNYQAVKIAPLRPRSDCVMVKC